MTAYLCRRTGARQLGNLFACLLGGSSSGGCLATVALAYLCMLLLLTRLTRQRQSLLLLVVVHLKGLRSMPWLLLCQLLRWAIERHLQGNCRQPRSCSLVLLLPMAQLCLPSGDVLLLGIAWQPLAPRLPLPCRGVLLLPWQLLAVTLRPPAGRGWRLLLPTRSLPLLCRVLLSSVCQPVPPWKGLLLLDVARRPRAREIVLLLLLGLGFSLHALQVCTMQSCARFV